MSVKNSPMRSTTNAPWDIRDLCWKSITLENLSPSSSTRPKNRATNRSPRTITRSPSPKRSCHHLQRIRPDPSDFFRRTCNHHPDAFRERNHHRKPRLHKPGDTFVRLRRKLFLIFEIFFLNIIWKTVNFFLPSSFFLAFTLCTLNDYSEMPNATSEQFFFYFINSASCFSNIAIFRKASSARAFSLRVFWRSSSRPSSLPSSLSNSLCFSSSYS